MGKDYARSKDAIAQIRMTNLLSRIFIKDWRNTLDSRVRRSYGTLASVVGVFLNLLLFAAKFTVGTLIGSVSIRADGINNLSDAGSQIVSFISFRISAKPADRKHPFGHARIEYVASMIVSFLVLHIGLDLLVESVKKITDPAHPDHNWVTLTVLAASIAVKLWLSVFNRRIGKRIDSSVMRATAADSLSDALSTAAVLLSAVVMMFFPQIRINLDAIMGVLVAAFILFAGIKLLLEAKDSILGEAPSDELVRQITEIVGEYPEALGIHDLEVHNYGPGHTVAALHVEVDGKRGVFLSHDMIDTIEQRLRRECGISATIHMDPIVTDDETVNALREQVTQAVREIDAGMTVHDFRFVAGHTHSNLIFDVAVPFENRMTTEEIRRAVADRVSRINAAYFTVITVDRH